MATSEFTGRHQICWVMLAMDPFRGSINTPDLLNEQPGCSKRCNNRSYAWSYSPKKIFLSTDETPRQTSHELFSNKYYSFIVI